MNGGLTDRFCTSCHRTVQDFSRLTRKQAEKLIRKSAGGLCARIAYTPEGKILFQVDAQPRFAAKLIQLSLLGVSAIAAQEPAPHKCDVTVKVSDPSGAPLPGASVTITQGDDPQSLTGKADGNGKFLQPLPAGNYDITVQSPGFRTYEEKNLNFSCQNGGLIEIKAPLQIGIIMGDVVEIAPLKPRSRTSRMMKK